MLCKQGLFVFVQAESCERMGYATQHAPGELLDNFEAVVHDNVNLVTLKANTPELWGRAVAIALFTSEELEQFVLEPGRIDVNTQKDFPSPTRIKTLRGQTVHWIGAQFCVCMFLDSRDKSLNMLKLCRKDQRKFKNKRRTKGASLLRNPLTMHKKHSLAS